MSNPQTPRGRYAIVAAGRGQLFTDDPEFARRLAAANTMARIPTRVVDTQERHSNDPA